MTETGRASFPTTDWGLLANVRGATPSLKRAALDILIRRYWRPVFSFLRYSGRDEESSKDLTQSFFAEWIENDVFGKADERQGRFRSFMLTCLKRFGANEHRAGNALKRKPAGGLLSLDELMDNPEMPFEPSGGMTPDMIFDRTWAVEVVRRVLQQLERECLTTGKAAHYDIFARRIINPILHGEPDPSLVALAGEHGLTEKQAANHLLTAKRAYRRLMEQEIRLYTVAESEVAEEVRTIFRILSG
jgi:DNA-directed RNA polymerase specialized sigma24 family protein